MYKKLILFSLYLFINLGIYSQPSTTDDLWSTDLIIRQKEGTNELLKNYLSHIPSRSDTLYAILFCPSYCPRCEGVIRPFVKDIKTLYPQAETLLITTYPDSTSTKSYLKRNKFLGDYYLFDTSQKYSQIFSFNSNGLIGLCILKLDKKNGRMIIGGEPYNYNKTFIEELLAQKEAIPYHTFEYNNAIIEKISPKDICPNYLNYKPYYFISSPSYPISGVYGLPILKDDIFIYTDELGNGAYHFQINKEKETATFITAIAPDTTEQNKYIDLPKEVFESQKRSGLIFYIPQTPNFIDKDNIGISYSLPKIFLEGPYQLAYYNQPAILVRDLKKKEKKDIITLDFDLFNEKYMYLHFSFFPMDSTHIIMGCKKNTWPIEYDPEDYKGNFKIDPFMDEFYTKQENPYLAIFDLKTGKPVKQFGNLEMPQRLSRTGYYYLEPIADVYENDMVYGNGYTGNLYIAKKKKPENVIQKINLFQIDTQHFPLMDTTNFYRLEHAKPYDAFFNRKITTVALTDKKVHCLISTRLAAHTPDETTTYEYVAVERNMGGKITRYPIIPQNKEERVLAYGLARMGKEVIPYYFAKQGERAVIKFVTLAK